MKLENIQTVPVLVLLRNPRVFLNGGKEKKNGRKKEMKEEMKKERKKEPERKRIRVTDEVAGLFFFFFFFSSSGTCLVAIAIGVGT